MSNTKKALGFALLIVLGCRASPAPEPLPESPVLAPVPEPAPPPPPEEPKAVQLATNLTNQGSDKAASELQRITDDPELSDAIKPLNDAIDDGQKKIQELKSRGDTMTPAEREEYNNLAMKLAEARKIREDMIDISYTSYRIEYKELNRTWMQKESEQVLLERLDELRGACAGPRKIVVMGFGCSVGREEITEEVSRLRATDTAGFLKKKAGCVEGKVQLRGLGVETPTEDFEGLDSVEKERILERSRFVKLLVPKMTVGGKEVK